MTYPLKKLLLICFILTGMAQLSLANMHFKTVILDPGHGGIDPGAGWNGLKEKNLNLEVSKRVEKILRKKGIPTVLTRRSDKYLSHLTRASIANKYSSSVFISIHFNAYKRDRRVHGIETHYTSPRGYRLGKPIQRSLIKRTASKNRGLKKTGYKVLVLTKSPAILVECGFMSNWKENKKMKSSAHLQKIAEAIASGIITARG